MVSALTTFHTDIAPAAVSVLMCVGVATLRSPIGRRVIILAGPAATALGALYLAAIVAAPGPSMMPDALLWAVYLVLTIAADPSATWVAVGESRRFQR